MSKELRGDVIWVTWASVLIAGFAVGIWFLASATADRCEERGGKLTVRWVGKTSLADCRMP